MDRRDLLLAVGISALGALSAACDRATGGATGPEPAVPRATSATPKQTPAVTVPNLAPGPPSRPPVSRSMISPTHAPPASAVNVPTSSRTRPDPHPPAPPHLARPASAAPRAPIPTLAGVRRVPPWDDIVAQVPDVNNNTFALTIDDGTSTETVNAYIDLAVATGLRLTFFLNGVYDAWTELAPKLRPLVESGQIQLGNHTWDHPYLTNLTDTQIMTEVHRNDSFIRNVYSLDTRPFFRPPYMAHNTHIDQLLVNDGFSVITWWTGSFNDNKLLTGPQILANARQYLQSNLIVIGHANHNPVISVMDQIIQIIHTRQLRPVTLRDVFAA